MSSQGNRADVVALGRPVVIPRPAPYVATPMTVFVPAPKLAPDPNNPIHTNQQQRMLWMLEHRGRWGLALELRKYAELQLSNPTVTNRKSWQYIVDDFDNGTYYMFIQLLTLPRLVLESLIKNTITRDIHTDRDVGQFHRQDMQTHGFPGVYLNVLGLSAVSGGGSLTTFAPNAGKWLTPAQAHDLAEAARLYAGTDNAADQYAKKIDDVFPKKTSFKILQPREPEDRRYFKSDSAAGKLETWSVTIDDQFYKNMAAHLHVPHRRCPTEVGWSQSVKDRQQHHVTNSSTTFIYGFANAWSHLDPSASGIKFPTPYQFALFRVWNKDALPQITEIMASMLCSSYWTEGGLNCIEAGGTGTSNLLLPQSSWKVNADHVFLSPNLENILASEWTMQHNRYIACRFAKPAELAKREAQNTMKETNIEKLKAEYKQLNEDLARLQEEQEERQRKRLEIPDQSSEDYRSTVAMIEKVNAGTKEEAEMIQDAHRRLLTDVKEEDDDTIPAPPPNPHLQRLRESLAKREASRSKSNLGKVVLRPVTESEMQEANRMLAKFRESKAATETLLFADESNLTLEID